MTKKEQYFKVHFHENDEKLLGNVGAWSSLYNRNFQWKNTDWTNPNNSKRLCKKLKHVFAHVKNECNLRGVLKRLCHSTFRMVLQQKREWDIRKDMWATTSSVNLGHHTNIKSLTHWNSLVYWSFGQIQHIYLKKHVLCFPLQVPQNFISWKPKCVRFWGIWYKTSMDQQLGFPDFANFVCCCLAFIETLGKQIRWLYWNTMTHNFSKTN